MLFIHLIVVQFVLGSDILQLVKTMIIISLVCYLLCGMALFNEEANLTFTSIFNRALKDGIIAVFCLFLLFLARTSQQMKAMSMI